MLMRQGSMDFIAKQLETKFLEVPQISSVAIHISPRWGEFVSTQWLFTIHISPRWGEFVSTQNGLNMNSHR
jgi:hypothetical protein